jgi:hypothetical protein
MKLSPNCKPTEVKQGSKLALNDSANAGGIHCSGRAVFYVLVSVLNKFVNKMLIQCE